MIQKPKEFPATIPTPAGDVVIETEDGWEKMVRFAAHIRLLNRAKFEGRKPPVSWFFTNTEEDARNETDDQDLS